jgi:WD40 repeat protein
MLGAISADGQFIALAAEDAAARLCILPLAENKNNTHENAPDLDKDTWVESIDFCGRTHVLAVGLRILVGKGRSEFGVLLWDCDSNRELGRIQRFPSGGEVYSMTSSDDGELLVLGFHHNSIVVCTTNPLRIIKELSAYDDSSIETWRSQQLGQDTSTWEERPLEPGRHSRSSFVPNLLAYVDGLALSHDGKWLASHAVVGVEDNPGVGEVKVWPLDKILPNQNK